MRIATREKQGPIEMLFYDGNCGLCHHAVLFVLKRDPDGRHFRFAPLGGEAFRAAIDEAERADLPDSIVIQTEHGALLTRSDAALHIGHRIGGIWRGLARLARLIPRPLRDAAYDGMARIRHRLFAKPMDACPLLPPDLRDRFDANP